MIWLYRIFFLPAVLLALPYYGWRMWRRGGYRRDFRHRFGSADGLPPKRVGVRRIWIQAVSVGELLALAPLLKALHADESCEVVLTTTTSTGRALLEERYSELTVWRGIFPLDAWPCAHRAWRRIQPDLAVLMESELWPEHLHQAHRRSVPVMLINARMSDRSAGRYTRLRALARPLLAPLSEILAATPSDAERFSQLGLACPVTAVGNLKFDLGDTGHLSDEERAALRAELGFAEDDLLLVGASTWPGEERVLAEAVRDLRADGLPVRGLIIPRHAERRAEVLADIASLGLSHALRTQTPSPTEPVELYIADTTGELRRLVQLADIAFIGKSLPPHDQGQTPIEAASYKKSIVFGPGMSNFRMITDELVQAGGATVVSTDDLASAVRERFTDSRRRADEGENAHEVVQRHSGSTARVKDALSARLRTCRSDR